MDAYQDPHGHNHGDKVILYGDSRTNKANNMQCHLIRFFLVVSSHMHCSWCYGL